MQQDITMNCSFGYQNIFLLLFYWTSEENKYLVLPPFSEIFCSSLQLPSSVRGLTFTSARLCDLQQLFPFSLVAHLTLSVLNFLIANIESNVSQLQPSSIILKIFYKHLTLREKQKLILTRFNFENILSNSVLGTGTVNNNLIITSTSLQPFLQGTAKILRHVTKYKTPAKNRVFYANSTNSYHYSNRSEINTFIPASFNEIRKCIPTEKIISHLMFFLGLQMMT